MVLVSLKIEIESSITNSTIYFNKIITIHQLKKLKKTRIEWRQEKGRKMAIEEVRQLDKERIESNENRLRRS